MKILICYKSKYGATKKYAQLLSEKTGADILEFQDVKNDTFDKYETIVISSGTYMGLMPLTSFLRRKWKRLKNKKVIVVAIGAAPAEDKWSNWSYKRIPQRIRINIKYFKLMGEDPEPARGPKYITKVKGSNLNPVLNYLNILK